MVIAIAYLFPIVIVGYFFISGTNFSFDFPK